MTLEYNQLLVAVDGSKEAEWAFKKSIGIAQRNNAALNLVYVVDSRTITSSEVYNPSIEEHTFKVGKDLLEKYKQEAEKAGIQKVNNIIMAGSPKNLISREVARKVNADLIICGASGLNPIERFVLGSVSQHIVRYSPCDVLVVRTEEHAEANA
ncbi:universal stress protein [Planococcus sp. 1R117A]|uniref:universal stress protein n=1 Tax=Planococcus sp. 1R117A TaxID=3447020 RepID=UPI003EDC0874